MRNQHYFSVPSFSQSCDSEGAPQRDPLSSTYLAAFCDRVEFGHRLWQEAVKQGYTSARTRKEANAQLPYFQNNAHRMKYGTFRRKGYFIGSGAVEGACRHVVAQRAKLSGMRWSRAGAENVLALRCIIKSNIFDQYCKVEQKAA